MKLLYPWFFLQQNNVAPSGSIILMCQRLTHSWTHQWTSTGTIRSSSVQRSPIFSDYTSPYIRKQTAVFNSWHKFSCSPNLFSLFSRNKNSRLKFRYPFWSHCCNNWIKNDKEIPRTEWTACTIAEKDVIEFHSNRVSFFDPSIKIWSVLNHIKTGHPRCIYKLFKWNSVDSTNCKCAEVEE